MAITILIEKGNKEQEKKFCPLIRNHCRRDCTFFNKAYEHDKIGFIKAYCKFNG